VTTSFIFSWSFYAFASKPERYGLLANVFFKRPAAWQNFMAALLGDIMPPFVMVI